MHGLLTWGGMTPPQMTSISGLLSFWSSLMSSGTRVLCPAASVLTPTQWTSASTACWATSRGVCLGERKKRKTHKQLRVRWAGFEENKHECNSNAATVLFSKCHFFLCRTAKMPKDHLMCLFVFMCHILITMKGFSIEMLFFNLLTVPTQSFTDPIITSKRLTLTLLDLFFHYTFLLIFFLTKPQRDFCLLPPSKRGCLGC